MKQNNKNNRKIRLYGVVSRKDLLILTLEKSEKFLGFLSSVFGNLCKECMGFEPCPECAGANKGISKMVDTIKTELGHIVHNPKIDGQIIYGKNRIFLFINTDVSTEKKILNKLEKSVEWVKVKYPKHSIKAHKC